VQEENIRLANRDIIVEGKAPGHRQGDSDSVQVDDYSSLAAENELLRRELAITKAKMKEKQKVDDFSEELRLALQYNRTPELNGFIAELASGYVHFYVKVLEAVDHTGMSPLHAACRALNYKAVHQFLEVAPHVANTITHPSGKPAGWTPLQCMVDNPFKWSTYSKEERKSLEHMVFDLVRKMDLRALRNQTASHYSKSGGGLTALHQLASRNCEHLLFHVI